MRHIIQRQIPDSELERTATTALFAAIVAGKREKTDADVAKADSYLQFGTPVVRYRNGQQIEEPTL
jgi:hypothetical protein